MIQSLNPANGKLLRSFDPITPEALNSKLAIAASAARTYPRESLDQRIVWMRRLAALLEHDLEELAALMTAEMGKTIASARSEVAKCAAVCRYYADNAAHILAPEHIALGDTHAFERRSGSDRRLGSDRRSPEQSSEMEQTSASERRSNADRRFRSEQRSSPVQKTGYIRYDPLGVILAVMPWNFPLWQVFRFAAPALMAGNVGLLKHASNVPQCALAIEALIRRAGFPRGCFQTLLIESRQVETVLGDKRIAAVTVTGSEAAGRAVAAQAGWLLKKSVLELGGSDPFIVLPSANLDEAVPNAIKSRCINNGQSCIAAKRFIVHHDVYDEFERRFVAGMARLRVGSPSLDSTEIGPLATTQVLDDLLAQISRAKGSNGRILTGGDRIGGQGNYLQPTVIAGLPRNAPICQEEIFGPVALLFRVSSLDDAVTLANETSFGLAASAWTTDDAEQQRLALDLQCGSVFFNAIVASDPRLPFGGVKNSGYGRELSAAGMREFLNAKTVVLVGPAPDQKDSFAEESTPDTRSERPKPRSENPEPRSENPEPRSENPEPRSEDPEPRRLPSEDHQDTPVEVGVSSDASRNFQPRKTPPPVSASRTSESRSAASKSKHFDDDPPPTRGSILGLR